MKWSATKWMHVSGFQLESLRRRTGCADYNDACATWAAAGECTRNKNYMVGSDGSMGECLKACGQCKA